MTFSVLTPAPTFAIENFFLFIIPVKYVDNCTNFSGNHLQQEIISYAGAVLTSGIPQPVMATFNADSDSGLLLQRHIAE